MQALRSVVLSVKLSAHNRHWKHNGTGRRVEVTQVVPFCVYATSYVCMYVHTVHTYTTMSNWKWRKRLLEPAVSGVHNCSRGTTITYLNGDFTSHICSEMLGNSYILINLFIALADITWWYRSPILLIYRCAVAAACHSAVEYYLCMLWVSNKNAHYKAPQCRETATAHTGNRQQNGQTWFWLLLFTMTTQI
jgi:hypothetical protein